MSSVPPEDERIDAIRYVHALALRAARRVRAAAAVPTPAPKPPRTRRPSPSRLAKWEAQWQADAAEGHS